MPEYHAGDRFGTLGRSGELILDESSAREINAIRAELKRLGRLAPVPPVTVDEDAGGRRIGIDLPPTFPAKLSGTGNPYSYTEQVAVAGGTWADRTGGRTGTDAYEANAVSGLSGKVVNLRLSDAGDWRFQWIRKGTAAIPFTGTVLGCFNHSSGLGVQTVTIKNGATTIWTGSTNASGVYSGTASLPTSVTVEVAANTYFAAFSGTKAVSGTTSKTIASATLTPRTGYTCRCANCTAPQPDGPILTDTNGSYTMAWGQGWEGQFGFRCCYLLDTDVYDANCFGATTTPGQMAVSYRLDCPATNGTFQLVQKWTSCNITTPFKPLSGTCISNEAKDTPFSGTKTFNAHYSGSGGGAPGSCNDSVTFTIPTGDTPIPGTVTVSFP